MVVGLWMLRCQSLPRPSDCLVVGDAGQARFGPVAAKSDAQWKRGGGLVAAPGENSNGH